MPELEEQEQLVNPNLLLDYTEYVDFFRDFALNDLDPDEITLEICMIAIVQNITNLNYVPLEFKEQLEEETILKNALWTQEIIDHWFEVCPLFIVFFPNEYITERMNEVALDALSNLFPDSTE